MLLLSQTEMKLLDKTAIEECGIPSLILMEYAAKSAKDYIRKNYDCTSRILIVCGSGNNGADGLCLARQLKYLDFDPYIYLIGDSEKLSEEGRQHYESLSSLNMNIRILTSETIDYEIDHFKKDLLMSTLVVDAIFGISLNREIEGIHRDVIEMINNGYTKVLSLDMPSGIEADTGEVLGIAVKADTTITFAHPKLGLYLNDGIKYSGKVLIGDIKIPKMAESRLLNPIKIIDEDIFSDLPKRDPSGHKGTFGKVLIVAGSYDMGGAAALSAKAAYRGGCGLVYVLTHRENKQSILSYIPEAIVYTYDDDFSKGQLEETLLRLSEGMDSVLIGCGLSKSETAKTLFSKSLDLDKPLVIDADALNILSEDAELLESLKHRKNKTVLSPHLGEMARLHSIPVSEIIEKPLAIAKSFVKEYKVNLCLKSSKTIVCTEKLNVYFNIIGNSGMATAGSGDVLSGLIAAKIALSESDEDFDKLICKAVHMHSRAGDNAKDERGEEAIIASDIIEKL